MTAIHQPIWHPFTQHAMSGPAIPIKRAEGAYLYSEDGRRILDAISSWWVNIHGHCHPEIVRAVQTQAAELEQVIFAGFTHAPAENLATALLQKAGTPYAHVFFSDSGSTAVEVALKMAIGFFAHRGDTKRRRIVALQHGYHGDTFGAMAAGARSVFNQLYSPYLFDVMHLPYPDKRQEDHTINTYKTWLAKHGDEIAALIVEPLVLGAGGMLMYPADVLEKLVSLSKQHGVLTIADEVMTGFGRTGTFLASHHITTRPDLICLSKGLTGGFLPMGATLATPDIFEAFYHPDKSKMFFHSSSFTGNALAAAAALASLRLWDREPVLARVQHIAAMHQKAAARFAKRPDIENVRTLGTILAFEVKSQEKETGYGSDSHEKADYTAAIGPRLYHAFMARNILLRPLGNTVYILPPYCMTDKDLEFLYDGIDDSLDSLRP
jgi:adenosylmethionine---8-amino-7-oxononanoate aminotransferase